VYEIISWKIYFQSDQKFHEFLRELENIGEIKGKTDQQYDIHASCPIRNDTYYLKDRSGKLKVELHSREHSLLGENSWLPFLAKYVEGEFKAEGEFSYDKWGARFDGRGNYKKLQVVEEWI
jgi:hypothetical protein